MRIQLACLFTRNSNHPQWLEIFTSFCRYLQCQQIHQQPYPSKCWKKIYYLFYAKHSDYELGCGECGLVAGTNTTKELYDASFRLPVRFPIQTQSWWSHGRVSTFARYIFSTNQLPLISDEHLHSKSVSYHEEEIFVAGSITSYSFQWCWQTHTCTQFHTVHVDYQGNGVLR